MRYYLKLYELIVFLDMALLKLLLNYELVYGQEVVLPVEVNLGAYKLAEQNNIDVETYYALMMDNIDEVIGKRLEALEEFGKDKVSC
jgi:hypothetical protein